MAGWRWHQAHIPICKYTPELTITACVLLFAKYCTANYPSLERLLYCRSVAKCVQSVAGGVIKQLELEQVYLSC